MFPFTFKFVDQVLNLKTDTRLHFTVIPLFYHSLQTFIEEFQANDLVLRLVLLLGLYTFHLVFTMLRIGFGRLLELGCVSFQLGFFLPDILRLVNIESDESVQHGAKNLNVTSS